MLARARPFLTIVVGFTLAPMLRIAVFNLLFKCSMLNHIVSLLRHTPIPNQLRLPPLRHGVITLHKDKSFFGIIPMRFSLKSNIQELQIAKYSVSISFFNASWKPCHSKERKSNTVAYMYMYTPPLRSASGVSVMFGRRINNL